MSESMRSRGPSCLSDLALDRLLAGELGGTEEGARVEEHLASCEACAGRRAALEAEAARFPEEHFLPGLAAGAVRKSKAGPLRWVASGAGALAAAAAVAALVVLPQGQPELEGYRSKGGASLEIFARSPDGAVEQILPGDEVSPGDAIRFQVESRAPGYVAVVGIDSAQAVTPYVPPDSTKAPLLAGHSEVLPGSIVLDGTLGPERIVALFCDDRPEVGTVVEASRRALAEAGGNPGGVLELDLPTCAQASFLIRKVPRK